MPDNAATFSAGALFAGIGGLCIPHGRKQIKTQWAVENDSCAVATYEKNLGGGIILKKEDEALGIEDVKVKKLDLPPVDVLHAGFPCQSFSMAGNRKGFDDPRGRLFYEIFRIVREFKDRKPSVLLLENSPHIQHGDDGKWFFDVCGEIKRAGYWFRSTNHAELDAYDLTRLPQRRKRLFMVAFSTSDFKNGKFDFPTKENTAPKDLKKYVMFEKKLNDDYYYLDKNNRYHSMISDVTKDRFCIYQLRKYLVRVKDRNVCPTLTANMGLGGHNVPFIHDKKGLRKLTEYECLGLQGFPRSFRFPETVSKSKRYMQAGNSVAIPVIDLLAQKIKRKLIEERICR